MLFCHPVQFQTSGPLQKVHWLRLVLDEGHTIRNANTQLSKAVFSLNADRKWVVTGLHDSYIQLYFVSANL